MLTQLRLTFDSDEFEGPENLIKVTRALQVTDESVDDANLVFDKFYLLEMLAFLKGRGRCGRDEMLKREQGFIQFDHNDPEVNAQRLKLLHSIYRIESNRVAGPNAGNIPFWCWSESWMANELGVSDPTRRRGLNALIKDLCRLAT